MQKYLIELYDIKTDKRFIVENNWIEKNESVYNFNKILKNLEIEHGELYMDISDNCEKAYIYKDDQLVQHGWLWNSKENVKTKLFELYLLELKINVKEKDSIVHYGYANNCFSPKWSMQLIEELTEKLSLPNFGLQKIND